MDELKDCPFCGSEAIAKEDVATGWFFVQCEHGHWIGYTDDDRSGIIEEWNTRAPDSRVARLVDAARKYLNTGFTSARGELRAALAALDEQL